MSLRGRRHGGDPNAGKLIFTTTCGPDDQFSSPKQIRWSSALGKLLVANGNASSGYMHVRNADLLFNSKVNYSGTNCDSDINNIYFGSTAGVRKYSLSFEFSSQVVNRSGTRMFDAAGDPNYLYITSNNATAGHGVNMVKKSNMSNVFSLLGTGAGEGQFNGPMGIKYIGGKLYICDSNNRRIQIISVVGETLVYDSLVPLPFTPYDICWDGTYFYVVSYEGLIYRFDATFRNASHNVSVDSDKYEAWPSAAKLSTGTLIVTYRVADTNVHLFEASGRVVIRKSTDGGVSWGAEIVAANSADLDDRNAGILVFMNGEVETVLVSYNNYAEDGSAYMYIVKSTNGGDNWGDPIQVSATNRRYGYGNPILLSNGHILIPSYSNNGSVVVFDSSDAGETWGAEVIAISDGTHMTNESSVVELKTDGSYAGRVLLLARSEISPYSYYQVISSDYGATWGTPSVCSIPAPSVANPPSLCRLSNDTIACSFTTNSKIYIYTSDDECVSWQNQGVAIQRPTFETRHYSHLVEISSGVYGVVWCTNLTRSDVYFNRLSLPLAELAANVVAYSIAYVPDQGDGNGQTLAITDNTNSHLARYKCSDLSLINEVGSSGDGSASLFDPTFTTSVNTRVTYIMDDGFIYTTPLGTSHALSWNGFAGYTFRNAGPHRCVVKVEGGLAAITAIDLNTDLLTQIKNCHKLTGFSGAASYFYFQGNAGLLLNLSDVPRNAKYISLSGNTLAGGRLADAPIAYTRLYIASCPLIMGSLSDFSAASEIVWAYGSTGITPASIAHLTALRDGRFYSMWPALSAAESVDIVIDSIWTARMSYTYMTGPSLQIGGTNPSPTGTYVAPVEGADWHQDGATWIPLTTKAKTYDLVNNVNSEARPAWAISFTV